MSRLVAAIALLTIGSSLSADERKPVDKSAEIEAILEMPTEVQYLDTQLGDVVSDLELRHRLNIELDARSLADNGQGSELPITKTLKDVPLASALDLLLTEYDLTWIIHNDVLLITTTQSEPKYLQTKVYVVGDLDENPETIGGILMQTLSLETWRPHDGGYGAMAPHEKSQALVITHSTRMHRRIAKLLNELRAVNEKGKK